MSERIRFDVGFIGGGTTNGFAIPSEWQRLESAFTSGDEAVIRLEAEGATLWVRASQIAWVRIHTRESRTGF